MSLINDALKQASKSPPRTAPSTLPPLQPAHQENSQRAVWLVPALIIFLVFAAIFAIGWAAAHRTRVTIQEAPPTPEQIAAQQQEPEVVLAPIPEPAPPPKELPRVQGIFYSPTSPSAIVDGKTVRPGDAFNEYKVKAITKFNVILIDSEKRELKLNLGR